MDDNSTENQLPKMSSNGVHTAEEEKSKPKTNHLGDSADTNKKPNNNGNGSESSSDVENTKPENEELPEGIRRGICKWFNSKKGFGFVTPEDGGKDVFVHQRVIKKDGFRSLRDNERVEFKCHISDKGLEATLVTGPGGEYCKGSKKVYTPKRVRCYNCGDFANHIAAKCDQGPMPKRCHNCKADDHLIADCPNNQSKEGINKLTKTPRKKSERQKSRPKSKPEEELGVGEEKQSFILPNQNGDEINDKKEKDN